MNLLQEVTAALDQPILPNDGWNVGHLAHGGILLSCENFTIRLDLEQLNVLFDYAEDGDGGELVDHNGKVVYVEVNGDGIVLSRDDDKHYPNGVVLDLKVLKELGIEKHEDESETSAPKLPIDGRIDPKQLEEGVKRAYRRAGKKIKPGFRVTSGWRKGRVVSNPRNAFKPRAKASTRMKLRIASKRRKIVRVLKAARTRRRPLSKRLSSMNKRVK